MDTCAICLEPLHDSIYITPCKHIFHDFCMNEYKKYTEEHHVDFRCPLCNHYMLPPRYIIVVREPVHEPYYYYNPSLSDSSHSIMTICIICIIFVWLFLIWKY